MVSPVSGQFAQAQVGDDEPGIVGDDLLAAVDTFLTLGDGYLELRVADRGTPRLPEPSHRIPLGIGSGLTSASWRASFSTSAFT